MLIASMAWSPSENPGATFPLQRSAESRYLPYYSTTLQPSLSIIPSALPQIPSAHITYTISIPLALHMLRISVRLAGTARRVGPTTARADLYGFADTLEAAPGRRMSRELGYGIRDTWDDLVGAIQEIAPTTLEGSLLRVIELSFYVDEEDEILYSHWMMHRHDDSEEPQASKLIDDTETARGPARFSAEPELPERGGTSGLMIVGYAMTCTRHDVVAQPTIPGASIYCSDRMFPEEAVQNESYVGGNMATGLMERWINTLAWGNKRKLEDAPRNNKTNNQTKGRILGRAFMLAGGIGDRKNRMKGLKLDAPSVSSTLTKVKKLENKLRQKRKREETEDEEDAEEQISPSTLEAAQILTNVASEGFKGSQAPHGSKIYRRKPKSTTTPTKVLDFEEPAERLVNTGSTPTAQVNTARVNTAELNTGETERVQRREGKAPMTEEDLQTEVQASKKSREQELQELAGLEAAQQLQATMDAETQRQIDLDALLARRLVEQEEEAAKEALATEFDYIQARLNADQILAEKIQQEEREQYSIEDRAKFLHDTIAAQRKFLAEQRSAAIRNKPPTISQLRNQMITYLKHVANKKHAELKSKSFEEIQVLYERYKKQDQTFVAIGSEEDERAIKKMNEQAVDKENEQKAESVHEEIKEAEGAKKRKLGTRRKLKAKRRKYTSGLTREDDDLKICLHIAPDEDKVVDAEILDHQYPIVEWQSFFLTTKPQHDPTKPLEDVYLNRITRSNGHQRFFSTLMGVLSILDREDLKAVYELVMEKYQDEIPEGFDKMLWGDLMIMFNQGDTADFWDKQLNWKLISWKLHSSSGVHTIMTSNGLVIHMLVENRYPLTKEVLSQMLDLKLETEEESTMALELIKFVKQQLEEFEDSNDDDLATSDHEEAERV
ncbi:hypothetical protein Tco_1228389 [Tanacetum coccineum]